MIASQERLRASFTIVGVSHLKVLRIFLWFDNSVAYPINSPQAPVDTQYPTHNWKVGKFGIYVSLTEGRRNNKETTYADVSIVTHPRPIFALVFRSF